MRSKGCDGPHARPVGKFPPRSSSTFRAWRARIVGGPPDRQGGPRQAPGRLLLLGGARAVSEVGAAAGAAPVGIRLRGHRQRLRAGKSAAEMLDDRFLAAFAIAGTAEDCLAQARAYLEAEQPARAQLRRPGARAGYAVSGWCSSRRVGWAKSRYRRCHMPRLRWRFCPRGRKRGGSRGHGARNVFAAPIRNGTRTFAHPTRVRCDSTAA